MTCFILWFVQNRQAHPVVRLLHRRDMILTIDVFYATRLQVSSLPLSIQQRE